MKNNKRKGFTLVELLVVIAILAILATVSVVGYTAFIERANVSNDETVITQLNQFLEALKADSSGPFYEELMANDGKVTVENIREITDFILEDSGLGKDNLVPHSAQHGYHIYFDIIEQKYVLIADKDPRTFGMSPLGRLFAGAVDYSQTAYPENCFTRDNQYFLVENGTELANIVAGFRTVTDLESLKELYAAIDGYKTKNGQKLTNLAGLFANSVFVTENGTLVYNTNVAHQNLFILPGATHIGNTKVGVLGENKSINASNPLITVNSDTTITVPAGVTPLANSLIIGGGKKVTIVIDADAWTPNLADANFTTSDVTIVVGGVEYVLKDGTKVYTKVAEGEGELVATLSFNASPVVDFKLGFSGVSTTPNESSTYLSKTGTEENPVYTIYLAYNHVDTMTILPTGFENAEGSPNVSTTDVTWTSSNGIITVENGVCTLNTNFADTVVEATVTAKAVGGNNVTRSVTFKVVKPISATVKFNGQTFTMYPKADGDFSTDIAFTSSSAPNYKFTEFKYDYNITNSGIADIAAPTVSYDILDSESIIWEQGYIQIFGKEGREMDGEHRIRTNYIDITGKNVSVTTPNSNAQIMVVYYNQSYNATGNITWSTSWSSSDAPAGTTYIRIVARDKQSTSANIPLNFASNINIAVECDDPVAQAPLFSFADDTMTITKQPGTAQFTYTIPGFVPQTFTVSISSEVSLFKDANTTIKNNETVKKYTNLDYYVVGNSGAIPLSALFTRDEGTIAGKLSVKVEYNLRGNDRGTVVDAAALEAFDWDESTGLAGKTFEIPSAVHANANNEYIYIHLGYTTESGEYYSNRVKVRYVAGFNVDAANEWTSVSSTNKAMVLHSDITTDTPIKVESGTIYGNNHKVTTSYLGDSSYFIYLKNGHIENLILTGPVYPDITWSGNYNTDGVMVASGTNTITNSYLFGFRAPVDVRDATVTITNSVIEGGTYANIYVNSQTNSYITLEDTITIQNRGGYKSTFDYFIGSWNRGKQTVYGLGIFYDTGSKSTLTMKGDTCQFNFIANNDQNNFSTLSTAGLTIKTTISTLFAAQDVADAKHDVSGTKFINMGVIHEMNDANDNKISVVMATGDYDSEFEYNDAARTFSGSGKSYLVWSYTQCDGCSNHTNATMFPYGKDSITSTSSYLADYLGTITK